MLPVLLRGKGPAGWAIALLLPIALHAQATLTTFALYNFENPSSSAAFYGDQSGNGNVWAGTGGVHQTTSNLAATGGNSAFLGGPPVNAYFAYGNGSIGPNLGQATNWGIDLLFKDPGSSNASTTVAILSAGNPGGSTGMGIFYDPVKNQITARINGWGDVGSASYVPGAWNSVALVNDGTNTTFWINYVAFSSVPTNPSAPDRQWHMFVNSGGAVSYTGEADNVKAFTFTGTFTAANLQAIPEPSTYGILAGLIGLGAAVAWRRRVTRPQ